LWKWYTARMTTSVSSFVWPCSAVWCKWSIIHVSASCWHGDRASWFIGWLMGKRSVFVVRRWYFVPVVFF
jgi:hypothetical protein